jgi:hypothetical protein
MQNQYRAPFFLGLTDIQNSSLAKSEVGNFSLIRQETLKVDPSDARCLEPFLQPSTY